MFPAISMPHDIEWALPCSSHMELKTFRDSFTLFVKFGPLSPAWELRMDQMVVIMLLFIKVSPILWAFLLLRMKSLGHVHLRRGGVLNG